MEGIVENPPLLFSDLPALPPLTFSSLSYLRPKWTVTLKVSNRSSADMGGHSVIKAPLSSHWTLALRRVSSAPPRSKPPFIFRAAIIEKAVRHKWSSSASVASTSNNLSGVTCPALLLHHSALHPPPYLNLHHRVSPSTSSQLEFFTLL